MTKLIIFNFILIFFISLILMVLKKLCRNNFSKNFILFILPVLTIICHCSSLLYHYLLDGSQMAYLKSNPNLILPIYPCNVVMWSCLVFGLLKNKESKVACFLIDYVFWFGIVSSLVGMFINIDFINNPTLLNYDVTKGIISHAFLLLNVLTLPVFGFVKVKLEKNILHIIYSIILMLIIGLYCNLVFSTLTTDAYAYNVNSMFLIHSPFEHLGFLKYPFISCVAIVIYFIIFMVCELFSYQKQDRWYNRIVNYFRGNKK